MDVNQANGGGIAAPKPVSAVAAVTDNSGSNLSGGNPVAHHPGVGTAYRVEPLHSTDSETTEKKDRRPKDVQELTGELNTVMESLNTDIRFKLHYKTNQLMVDVVDVKHDKVLMESPPHEFLDSLARIKELVGTFLNKEV